MRRGVDREIPGLAGADVAGSRALRDPAGRPRCHMRVWRAGHLEPRWHEISGEYLRYDGHALAYHLPGANARGRLI